MRMSNSANVTGEVACKFDFRTFSVLINVKEFLSMDGNFHAVSRVSPF